MEKKASKKTEQRNIRNKKLKQILSSAMVIRLCLCVCLCVCVLIHPTYGLDDYKIRTEI